MVATDVLMAVVQSPNGVGIALIAALTWLLSPLRYLPQQMTSATNGITKIGERLDDLSRKLETVVGTVNGHSERLNVLEEDAIKKEQKHDERYKNLYSLDRRWTSPK